MRGKRRNTNLKILQSQLQHLAVADEKPPVEVKGTCVELPIIEKLPKKRGIEKDELISTKRLLTM